MIYSNIKNQHKLVIYFLRTMDYQHQSLPLQPVHRKPRRDTGREKQREKMRVKEREDTRDILREINIYIYNKTQTNP